MSDRIQPFLFAGELMVRVLDRDGSPWFILSDVCAALEIVKPDRAASRLDADEKGAHTMSTLGGPQEVVIISESGLYSLTLTSRKPAAKRFKKWITAEVLPSIRRTGSYTAPVSPAEPEYLRPKDYDEWTLEEIRTHLSVANGYRHTLNNASSAWYLMRKGFPRPPERLMPAWWQSDFDLRNPRGDGRSVTIIVPQGGETH